MTNDIECLDSDVDIVIVGGGLAGLSMAAALSNLPIRIVILEHAISPLQSAPSKEVKSNYSPSFDDRALALSSTSINILKNIGVLSDIDILNCTPIEQIHVSDKGHIGMLRMKASDLDEENFGRVIAAPLLGSKLVEFNSIKDFNAEISVIDQSKVSKLIHQSDTVTIEFKQSSSNVESEKSISAQLAILADGGRSNLAEQIGLIANSVDYEQVGILCNVIVEQEHKNIAYERFTESGPIALLPIRQNEYKLVWTVLPSQEQQLLAWSDEEFLDQLQNHFGFRAGIFKAVGKRVSYPLRAKSRSQLVSGRVALIGNAAHSLHPIAGQGFNLGLRDVACLAEILTDLSISAEDQSNTQAIDFGKVEALFEYQSSRENDVERTAFFTDQLVKVFSTSSPPIAMLRSLGILALDRHPSLKKQFMRKLMGFSDQSLRLVKDKL